MKNYILTGAPGAGKTAILRALEQAGLTIVEEAATDVIALAHARGVAEPHLEAGFTEDIAALQAERRRRAAHASATVVFDRSPVCTAALAAFLGHRVGPVLAAELTRIEAESPYEPEVFFIETLGFVTSTAARRISYEETMRFEAFHRRAYAERGFRCLSVAPGSVMQRAAAVAVQMRGL